jgi:cytochrome c oxidase subunit IV
MLDSAGLLASLVVDVAWERKALAAAVINGVIVKTAMTTSFFPLRTPIEDFRIMKEDYDLIS